MTSLQNAKKSCESGRKAQQRCLVPPNIKFHAVRRRVYPKFGRGQRPRQEGQAAILFPDPCCRRVIAIDLSLCI
jgi:hypothetical protein